jgi:4-amino-4-deoxy-L-arabinose transferase-like glycosyltransferase
LHENYAANRNLMEKEKTSVFVYIIITIAGALLFVPFLGGVHLFDWDEINFAETAREMLVTGDYLNVRINYELFWEKPPFFFWLQVLSMKIFGVNEIAARLPNAVCGIITLLVLFQVGKKVYDESFGWIWVLSYAGSILPFLYFKSGIIDPWFNLFIFLGIYFFYRYCQKEKNQRGAHVILSAVFIGLAVLTKGPAGFLIFSLTAFIFLFTIRFCIKTNVLHVFLFIFFFTLVGGAWFILQIIDGNLDILKDFIEYQVELFKSKGAGHGGFFGYHLVVLFFGVFPASIFALQAFRRNDRDKLGQNDFKRWMILLFFVVLILFSIVRTKIVHYSSMCYFPLTFLGSYVLYYWVFNRIKLRRSIVFLITLLGILYGGLYIALTNLEKFKDEIISRAFIKDPFALANLQASPAWKGYEMYFGIAFIVCLIVCHILFAKRRERLYMVCLHFSTIVFIYVSMVFVVPRIEEYSQAAAIEFYKNHQQEDCYFEPLGFKSYAHYFYGRVPNHGNDKAKDEAWLLKGDIDKKVYFVIKIHKKDEYLNKYKDIHYLYEKNGFVFCERTP